MGEFSSHDAYGVNEGEPVGVDIGLECGFVHEAADGEMGQQEAVEFLTHEFWSFAAQDDTRPAQVRFEFIQRVFDFPPFVIERGEFVGRCFVGIQQGRNESIARFRVRDAFQRLLDDAHHNPVGLLAPVALRGVNAAQKRTIGQSPFTGQPKILLHAPHQLRAGRPGLFPRRETEEVAVG